MKMKNSIKKQDIEDLKMLIRIYKKQGKLDKASACEKELDEIKKKGRK